MPKRKSSSTPKKEDTVKKLVKTQTAKKTGTRVHYNLPTVDSRDVSKDGKQETGTKAKMTADVRSVRTASIHQTPSCERRVNTVFKVSASPTSQLIATSNDTTTNEKSGIAEGESDTIVCDEKQLDPMPDMRTAGIFGFHTIDTRTACTSTTKGTAGLRGEISVSPDTERAYDVSCEKEKKNQPVKMAPDVQHFTIASVDQTMIIDSRNYFDGSTSELTSSRLIATSKEATTIEENAVADEEIDAIDCFQDQSH